MGVPDPADAPVTFALDCTVHVKVVPATALGLVMATLVDEPLQMDLSAAKASGILFTASTAF